MQVVKTKIISLNFKLKQQHFELQPASVKDYSSCFQVAIFNKLLFPPMAFLFCQRRLSGNQGILYKERGSMQFEQKKEIFWNI